MGGGGGGTYMSIWGCAADMGTVFSNLVHSQVSNLHSFAEFLQMWYSDGLQFHCKAGYEVVIVILGRTVEPRYKEVVYNKTLL